MIVLDEASTTVAEDGGASDPFFRIVTAQRDEYVVSARL